MRDSDKHHLLIANDSLDKLYNAVLLQGFFADSKRVKAIFKEREKRLEAAEFLAFTLSGRQSVIGVSLQAGSLQQLISVMKSNASLSETRLPNPFHELPQLSIKGITSVMQVLLAQSAVLTSGENMMIHFLNDDLEKAYQAASELETEDALLNKYRTLIHRQYQQAREFDNLLDDLLN